MKVEIKKDENCIFCKIVAQEIPSYKVYEDENFYGFLSIQPNTKGHTVLIPKDHSGEFLEVYDELLAKYIIAGKNISKKMKDVFKSKKVACAFAGLQVPHTHLNIFPLNHAEDFNTSSLYNASTEELKEVQQLLTN